MSKTILYEHQVESNWSKLPQIRAEAKTSLTKLISDKGHLDSIVMAISELCENIVKYALNQKGGTLEICHFTADKTSKEDRIVVITKNPATPEAAETIEYEISGLNVNDLSELDSEFEKRIMRASERDDISRLGLVRIAMEAHGKLEMNWRKPELTIKVTFPTNPINRS